MCDHAPNREAAMVRLSEKVWCDPCLAPLVRALNDAGMPTVASCCGHGRRPPMVALADGREVIVARSFEEARAITAGFPDINAPLAERIESWTEGRTSPRRVREGITPTTARTTPDGVAAQAFCPAPTSGASAHATPSTLRESSVAPTPVSRAREGAESGSNEADS